MVCVCVCVSVCLCLCLCLCMSLSAHALILHCLYTPAFWLARICPMSRSGAGCAFSRAANSSLENGTHTHTHTHTHTYTQGQTHVNKRRSLYMNTSITSPPLISLPSPPHFCLQKTMHATHLRSWNFGLCSGAALKQRVRISCIASWHLQWQWANQFMA